MKVAQFVSTIPDLLPPEYAEALQTLQSQAPPMGLVFVKRRMQAELGPDWQAKFQSFDLKPAAAASLGQVHRAVSLHGEALACKLQYPDMQSAVEADLSQLGMLFAIHARLKPGIDTAEIKQEIGDRIREELDYAREAAHARLYAEILAHEPDVRVPGVRAGLSTKRLLTLDWLEGEKLLAFKESGQDIRNRLARALFRAWWLPLARFGVIHGDPHLGNYTVFRQDGEPAGINLLDYGCIRIFPVKFVGAVVDLYRGLLAKDEARIMHAYETWGFKNLSRQRIDTMNIWASFIFRPMLDDRVRSVADGVKPSEYGRREVFQVHQALKQGEPVRIPREFVFMDRAAIGLGSVFLHLKAELNFFQLFNEAIESFELGATAARQSGALERAGLAIT